MTPTLEQFRVLTKVVEAGSITRAADVLDMQRSNVSRTLAQLEALLGVKLLERTTRSQSVTEVGRAVYERATAALAAADDAVQLSHRLRREPEGLLRVTCRLESGMAAVGAWVEAYLERYPRVSVEVEYASRDIDLVLEGFDLAVRAGPLPPSRLAARRLGLLRHGLYASPAYLAGRERPATPAALARHSLVVFTGETAHPAWTLESGTRREVVRAVQSARLRVNTGAGVRTALLRGLGIGLLPAPVAQPLMRDGQLRRVLPRWEPSATEVYAVYPSSRYLSPKVRAFVDLAIDLFPA